MPDSAGIAQVVIHQYGEFEQAIFTCVQISADAQNAREGTRFGEDISAVI